MTDPRRATRELVGTAVAALLLVAAIDVFTNSIDIERFDWDFRYYIDMVEHGFGASLASPFAYRYLTPLLARGLAALLQLTIWNGFAVIAYVGAIAQLLGVFLLVRWYTRSTRGAWFAMLITAFSLYNVKFLLFDRFRPDHLAYPLILLQAYFALSRKFPLLLLTTMVGCQIREFNAVPLLAYLCASMRPTGDGITTETRRRVIVESAAAVIGLGIAILLPRLLIPVSEDFQFASLTRDGILRVLLAPFVVTRDVNFAFAVTAYILPLLMLGGPRDLFATMRTVKPRDRTFLGAYSGLVLLLGFLGGTDFPRFSSYLVLPQVVVLGLLVDKRPALHLSIVLALVFGFNRIWLPFPMQDVNAYLDFYGGFGTRFDRASLLRIGECVGLVAVGLLSMRLLTPAGRPSPPGLG